MLLLFQAQTPSPRGSLQGRVVRLGSSDPIVRARILLARAGGQLADYRTAVTEEGGTFAFRDLAPGTYRVYADREGYLRTEFGQRGTTGVPITVAAGQSLKDIVVTMTPPGVITGRILDKDRNPVPHVWVRTLQAAYRDGQRSLNTVGYAETNDLGEYRIFGLAPAPYFVSALPWERPRIESDTYAVPVIPSNANNNQNLIRTAGVDILLAGGLDPAALSHDIDLTVYYPGTTDADAAASLDLGPGATLTGIDLTTVRLPTVHVRGKIINGVTGQPAQNAVIQVISRGQPRVTAITRASMGSFELDAVPSRSYDLIAEITSDERLFARIPIEVGTRDLEDVAVVLRPGVTITGRLTVEGRVPVSTDPIPTMPILNLNPGYGIRPAPDGAFSVTGLRPGDYTLLLLSLPSVPGYLKKAQFGSTDALNGIHIEGDPEGRRLEIVVSLNPGTLDALVLDDKQRPVAGAIVATVPEPAHRDRSDRFRTATTDASGRARIQGLAPGDYKLFATEDIQPAEWQNPNLIRVYESRGEPFRIEEGGTQTLTVRILPPRN